MKIAIAGFQHETNRFAPIETSYDDFVREDGWPGMTFGQGLWDVFLPANIPLGGFLNFAKDRPDVEVVPILWASAEPAGLVQDEAFDRIADLILDGLEAAMPLDGVYLDLHGAMVCQSFEDGEGEFLNRLRQRFGLDLPVSVSLDLHANITPEMFKFADLMTVYRTYPHIDMAETGYRAGKLLYDMIHDGREIFGAYQQLPFLLPLQAQCTTLEPARSIYGLLPKNCSLESGTADIALGFPASDIAQMGPAYCAYSYSKETAHEQSSLVRRALEDSVPLFDSTIYRPKEAIELALSRGKVSKPIILADAQDVSGAGSTSDSTELLSELANAGVRNCAVGALFDTQAVEKAHELGVGAEFELLLGDKFYGPEHPGFHGKFRVAALSNGQFKYHGEMMSGVTANIGPTAAIDLIDGRAEIRIVITSERIQCLDQAILSHVGVIPAEKSLLAIKSVVHFRADFEPIAEEIIIVEARGYSPCRFKDGLFTRLRDGVRLL